MGEGHGRSFLTRTRKVRLYAASVACGISWLFEVSTAITSSYAGCYVAPLVQLLAAGLLLGDYLEATNQINPKSLLTISVQSAILRLST
jgi:hypothetical protein